MEVKGPQSVTYFNLMQVKGPQSDIIKIYGSESASLRDITKTSFLNVLGHFQRRLLFDHEKSDIIRLMEVMRPQSGTQLRLMEVNGPHI